jgi:hypothetical protein
MAKSRSSFSLVFDQKRQGGGLLWEGEVWEKKREDTRRWCSGGGCLREFFVLRFRSFLLFFLFCFFCKFWFFLFFYIFESEQYQRRLNKKNQ